MASLVQEQKFMWVGDEKLSSGLSSCVVARPCTSNAMLSQNLLSLFMCVLRTK